MKFLWKRSVLKAGLFLSFLTTVSCATYQGKVGKSRNLLETGEYSEALKYLEPLAEKKDGDQLVYLLDYAVALQVSGKIKESNQALQKADRLAEFQDYTSLSREAGSLLFSQEMVQYKGDSFEKIFINAFGALNYLELGMLDDALVETRRMNEKYNKINTEDRKAFEKNVFGKYLSAMIWEADQKWDDAYIAYEEAYKLDPTIPNIDADLIRSAKRSRRMDSYQKWKKTFPKTAEKPEWYDRNYGELVVVYEQGWGPRKMQIGNSITPILSPVSSRTSSMDVSINGGASIAGYQIYNVERAAIETLQHDYAWMAAKRIGAFATKEIVADQIRQQDQTLGTIALIAMYASERADLRQWSTLPKTIQILRVPLKVGEYSVKLQGKGYSGEVTADQKIFDKVVVKSQKTSFLRWRTLR